MGKRIVNAACCCGGAQSSSSGHGIACDLCRGDMPLTFSLLLAGVVEHVPTNCTEGPGTCADYNGAHEVEQIFACDYRKFLDICWTGEESIGLRFRVSGDKVLVTAWLRNVDAERVRWEKLVTPDEDGKIDCGAIGSLPLAWVTPTVWTYCDYTNSTIEVV